MAVGKRRAASNASGAPRLLERYSSTEDRNATTAGVGGEASLGALFAAIAFFNTASSSSLSVSPLLPRLPRELEALLDAAEEDGCAMKRGGRGASLFPSSGSAGKSRLMDVDEAEGTAAA